MGFWTLGFFDGEISPSRDFTCNLENLSVFLSKNLLILGMCSNQNPIQPLIRFQKLERFSRFVMRLSFLSDIKFYCDSKLLTLLSQNTQPMTKKTFVHIKNNLQYLGLPLAYSSCSPIKHGRAN